MLYGEELFIRDAAAEGGSPVNLNAAVAAIYSPVMLVPGIVSAFGFRVTTTFAYSTAVNLGVLTLYRYTRSIQTIAVGNAGGTGYAVGDQFTITQTGATGGVGIVTAVTAGVVTGVALRPFGQGILPPDSAGVNYTGASNLATVALTGAGDNALTVTIVTKLAMSPTLTMTDALPAGKVVKVDVTNPVTNEVPVKRGKAIFGMGESLVIEITTQATGGSYPAGAYQPFIHYHNVGTSGMQSQYLVVDQTVAITGSWTQVG